MGYDTDFEGEIEVRPRLSDAFVQRYTEVSSRRNNIYADGERGSFDDVLFGKCGDCGLPRLKYDNPGWTGVPGCWVSWVLVNEPDQDWTTLRWEGNSKFYNYVQWLQLVVDFIIKENQDLAETIAFQGSILWNQDRETDDKGVMTVKKIRNKWKVHIQVSAPFNPIKSATMEFYNTYTAYYRGNYCPVLWPGEQTQAVVERKEEAEMQDDPMHDPSCKDWALLEVYKKPQLRSLLHLCLSIAASHSLQSQQIEGVTLPDELQSQLANGGRHCSGCGKIFWGPASVVVPGVLPIGYSGLPMLGRYCSLTCWTCPSQEGDQAQA